MVDQSVLQGVTPSAPAGAAEGAPANETPYAWFVVLALALTNMVAFLERQIVTLLYGPIKAAFGISDTQVSLLSGLAFVLFAAVFGLFFGRLADRASRKWIITIGVVAWSAATTVCGLAGSYIQLLLGRIMVGVGESTLGPSAMSMIADYFPRHRLARGMGVYTASVSAGAGLALVAGGAAIQFVGKLPPLDVPGIGPLAVWQMAFVMVGIGGLVVLLPLAFVKEPARKGAIGGAAAAKGLPLREVFGYVAQRRGFYLNLCVGFSLATILASGTVAWMPTFFIRHHGWAPQEIGYAYGLILATCGVVGVLLGARASEWMDARGYRDTNIRLPLIVMALATIPSAAVPMIPDPRAALVVLAVAALIGSMATAPLWAALQMVTPNQMRGQTVAMFSFVVNIVGMGVGPLIVALITDFVFRDEAKLGGSLIVATLVLKPVILLLFWFCLRGYREGLAAYEALTGEGRS